jgi:hypothetical protein
MVKLLMTCPLNRTELLSPASPPEDINCGELIQHPFHAFFFLNSSLSLKAATFGVDEGLGCHLILPYTFLNYASAITNITSNIASSLFTENGNTDNEYSHAFGNSTYHKRGPQLQQYLEPRQGLWRQPSDIMGHRYQHRPGLVYQPRPHLG